MNPLTPERIQELAAQGANGVADRGSPGAEAHNIKTIAYVIQLALDEDRQAWTERLNANKPQEAS